MHLLFLLHRVLERKEIDEIDFSGELELYSPTHLPFRRRSEGKYEKMRIRHAAVDYLSLDQVVFRLVKP